MMKGLRGRFLSKYKSLPTMTSLKQSFLPHLNLPTLHESIEHNNILSVPEITKDVVQEQALPSPLSDQSSLVLEEFQELPRKTKALCEETQKKDQELPSKTKALCEETQEEDQELPSRKTKALCEETQKKDQELPSKTKALCEETQEEDQELPSRKTKALCEETQKEDQELPSKTKALCEENQELPTLREFEEKCPPGGTESVVLYTTSMRGINKTFEDCKKIRFLLESFNVVYHERDVSMHLEYREELWNILGGRVIPPRLFIKGRLIGGADEVVGLHERGALRKLLKGIPLVPCVSPCKGCCGMRFALCLKCHGSCKITAEDKMNVLPIRCPDCNENGLIKCPLCN